MKALARFGLALGTLVVLIVAAGVVALTPDWAKGLEDDE